MSAAALGVLAKRGLAVAQGSRVGAARGGDPSSSRPFAPVPLNPASVMVDGLPFEATFTGDFYNSPDIPFHSCQNCFDGGKPPAPTEETDVVVIGAGISGLATAFLLKKHNPIVFELRPRVGGSAQGEIWGRTRYSIGNAYVITPDSGSFEDRFYRALGLDKVVRVHDDSDLIELGGELLKDFWSGSGTGLPPDQIAAFERYGEVVVDMGENHYPVIPLLPDEDNQWILELDQKSLRQDIEDRMGMPMPPLLAAAVQAYCHSSFGAGAEEISAAGGWNFLAAEQYGRWVFPGSNAYMADALWRRLQETGKGATGDMQTVRAGCRAVDVRLVAGDRVQVTSSDADGQYHSLLARRVVMSCPKFIAEHMIHDLPALDLEKYDAINRLEYRAYVVANVLLDTPIDRAFYDVFLLGDGNFPMSDGEAAANSKVVDMLNGNYARESAGPRSVLTLYWPLPFGNARFRLVAETAWQDYATQLVPQIHGMLDMLDVPVQSVRQVRMTRWAHAMPLAGIGLMANGTTKFLRRPIDDRIYFVNQDNWALPAVENSILEAQTYAAEIASAL